MLSQRNENYWRLIDFLTVGRRIFCCCCILFHLTCLWEKVKLSNCHLWSFWTVTTFRTFACERAVRSDFFSSNTFLRIFIFPVWLHRHCDSVDGTVYKWILEEAAAKDTPIQKVYWKPKKKTTTLFPNSWQNQINK